MGLFKVTWQTLDGDLDVVEHEKLFTIRHQAWTCYQQHQRGKSFNATWEILDNTDLDG